MRPSPPAPLNLRTLGLSLLVLCLLGAVAGAGDVDPRSFERQAWLGLSVRDGPEGTLVVAWVSPGPLGPDEDGAAPTVRRDDNVVSLDGVPRDAEGFRAYLRTKLPGEEVALVVRRSPQADPKKAIPTGGAGGEERTLKVVLAKRSEWAGTVGRAAGTRAPRFDVPAAGAYEEEILARASELDLRAITQGVGGGLDALLARLRDVQDDALDTNSLPAVVAAFQRPLALDALESALEARMRAAAATPTPRAVMDAVVLALSLPALRMRPGRGEPPSVAQRRAALEADAPEQAAALRALVRLCRDGYAPTGPGAAAHIRVLGDGFGVQAREVLSHVSYYWLGWLQLRLLGMWHLLGGSGTTPARPMPQRADLPPLPPGAVEGEVVWRDVDEHGRALVVGGSGPNRYDMAQLGGVLDLGGDDTYVFQGDGHAFMSVIRDLGGNDLYESSSDFQGPGTTVMGVSWLEDMEGNDVYRSTGQGSIAVGIGGIGVLIDHAGDDLYENRGPNAGWSMGVGYYGAGILIDRAGNDTYRGEKLCQGVGGPLGLGLVLDVKGNDRYDADGPSFPSAYGTPGVHVGMSQGFGYGVRGYAAGGVGALYDLEGDDRYTAGEFSQGGAYYFALGVLHDGGGNDLYHGNRYGQAFAAHQAIGILVDDAGDDTYWSMTAASQSGAWDESITLLLDKAGNDTYQCDGLGQGSAAMQAIAILVDVAGRDRYVGRGASVQGQGGNNTYHYDADRVFSFSALLDLGGSDDLYSSGRANGSVVATGALRKDALGESDLAGLFVDR